MKIYQFLSALSLALCVSQNVSNAAGDYQLLLDSEYGWTDPTTPWLPDGPPAEGDNLTLYRATNGNGILNLNGDRTLGILKANGRQVNIVSGTVASSLTVSEIQITGGRLGFNNTARDSDGASAGALSIETGSVNITGGALRLGTGAIPLFAFTVNQGTTIATGGSIDISATGTSDGIKLGTLINDGNLQLATGSSSTFAGSRSYTVEAASLSGTANGAKVTTSVTTDTAELQITLALMGSNLSAANYAGVIEDGGSNAAVSLSKEGDGIQILANGSNTYSGGTVISGGLLAVTNASGNALGSGAVLVESGGSLGGTGVIATGNAVTIKTGASLAPGQADTANLGVLRFGENTTVTMQEGASFDFRFGQNDTSDRVDFANYLANNLLLADDGISINGTQVQAGEYTLFTFHGIAATELEGLTGLLRLGDGFEGYAGAFSYTGGGGEVGEILLTVTVIPEPQSLAIIGAATVLGIARWGRCLTGGVAASKKR